MATGEKEKDKLALTFAEVVAILEKHNETERKRIVKALCAIFDIELD